MINYEGTIKFWNERFGNHVLAKNSYKPDSPLSFKELEEGVNWLVKESGSIIDFGCGSGSILFRSLYLGARSVIGIDISSQAIELANQTSREIGNSKETRFIEGGVDSLKKIKTDSCEAAISSNTIDNILPEDAMIVLKELNRILKKKGKLLIKLNDIMPKAAFEDDYYQLISEDFYLESIK